ncbi:hypothetical protein M427DRAFT_32895, partial [Gonapodya prolifera JEL478]
MHKTPKTNAENIDPNAHHSASKFPLSPTLAPPAHGTAFSLSSIQNSPFAPSIPDKVLAAMPKMPPAAPKFDATEAMDTDENFTVHSSAAVAAKGGKTVGGKSTATAAQAKRPVADSTAHGRNVRQKTSASQSATTAPAVPAARKPAVTSRTTTTTASRATASRAATTRATDSKPKTATSRPGARKPATTTTTTSAAAPAPPSDPPTGTGTGTPPRPKRAAWDIKGRLQDLEASNAYLLSARHNTVQNLDVVTQKLEESQETVRRMVEAQEKLREE